MKKISAFFIFFLIFASAACAAPKEGELAPKERVVLDSVLAHWETWVPAKKTDGSAPLIKFKELYQGLNPEQAAFLDKIRAIHPSGLDFDPSIPFKKIEGQTMTVNGKPEVIPIQYLPQNVYDAYEIMMQAMKKDLGQRLYVESGYRSPAYQLYTFLYYTPKHGYSIKETNRWVALPGHSEHGNPKIQAIDFINEQGIDGDSDRAQTQADFEKLPEYEWLQKNAGKFGFVLSYPRGTKGTNFEPWHWRYEQKSEDRGQKTV